MHSYLHSSTKAEAAATVLLTVLLKVPVAISSDEAKHLHYLYPQGLIILIHRKISHVF